MRTRGSFLLLLLLGRPSILLLLSRSNTDFCGIGLFLLFFLHSFFDVFLYQTLSCLLGDSLPNLLGIFLLLLRRHFGFDLFILSLLGFLSFSFVIRGTEGRHLFIEAEPQISFFLFGGTILGFGILDSLIGPA